MEVEVQIAVDEGEVPDPAHIRDWAGAALADQDDAELVIRVVDESEGQALNSRYRDRDCATNVLSFPCELPSGVPAALLGDIVICAPIVAREAEEQGKEPAAHWAHMVVHGVLHLLGYDHEESEQAARMESRERDVLAGLGFPDPYREAD